MKPILDGAWTIPVPGTIVAGKYVVETECGRDGLAAILSAIQLGLERRVVIRVLLPEWADDPQAIEQFRRAGRAAARASDAGSRVFDSGKLDSGAPYQVLDYLGEHEFEPVDRSTSDAIKVRGSDRVVAGALLMLGALGTAAFMWLYSTVHENDGHNLGATLMQPTTNVLDDGGVDGQTDTTAVAAATPAMDAGTLATGRVNQGGVDAGPFDGLAPVQAAVPPLAAATPPSEGRAREARSEVRNDAHNTEPRPPRTVVHVEPDPVPAPAPDLEPANPYGSNPYGSNPYGSTTSDDEPSRGHDAGAQARPSSGSSDDNGPTEDRLLDRRE